MHLLVFYLCLICSILINAQHMKRAEEAASIQPPPASSQPTNLPQPLASNNTNATPTQSTSNLANGTLHTNSTQTNATQSANGNPFAGKPTFASFSNDIPPAYLTWKKPIPNQTFPPLFKIGVSNITFEWTVDPNVLKVQPENLTVALANPQKQTLTAAIVPGTATSAVWDLAHLPPGSPLMVGYYTVWVHDQRGPKAYPSPGWLMPDSRLIVAMYSTESYVGRTDSMFCPTCYLGAGASFRESLLPLLTTFGIALLTTIIMMLSILK
ncbi:hypothetical protein EDC96DRAFT_469462 [Choanephora cucurbitarum]|nr:hypothetical protein EDC96DRAFT_469462 [Choanephora cucurbitarum]